jgi:hypothetical protein
MSMPRNVNGACAITRLPGIKFQIEGLNKWLLKERQAEPV